MGNVLVTINDRKQGFNFTAGSYTYFEATVIQAIDYFPFGLEMPGRTFQAANTSAYRFGFNDKENDRGGSWSSTQLVQDYGMRLYNPAIGKFLSVDPLQKDYPALTPYQFASNKPVAGIDIDGNEFYFSADGRLLGQGPNCTSNEVFLALAGGTTDNNGAFIPLLPEFKNPITGNPQYVIKLHNDYNTFTQIVAIVHVEMSSKDQLPKGSVWTWEEAAGIYSVLETRSKIHNMDIGSKLYESTGVEARKDPETKNVIAGKFKDNDDRKKYKLAFYGVVRGIIDEHDYSNGATTWDGPDLFKKGEPAYNDRYMTGLIFDNKNYDIFKKGDNTKTITITDASGKRKATTDHKYHVVGAAGGTTFLARNPLSFGKTGEYPEIGKYILDNLPYLNSNNKNAFDKGLKALIDKYVKDPK